MSVEFNKTNICLNKNEKKEENFIKYIRNNINEMKYILN